MRAQRGLSDRRKLVALIAAIGIAQLLVTVVLLPHFEQQLSPTYGVDRGDLYDRLAKSLLEGQGYRFTPDTAPTLLREPGYPMFLAAISWATGYSASLARAANVVCTCLCAFVLAAIVRRLTRSRFAYFGAPLLYLLHPGVIIAELRVGVEPLYTLLLVCFLLALASALQTRRLWAYLIAGAVLGLVTSVRSTALMFPVFLVFYFLIWDRHTSSVRHAFKGIVAIYCAAFLVLMPWIWRNYQLVDQFIPTASVLGTSLHSGYYMCTHANGEKTRAELDVEAATARGDLAQSLGYRVLRRYYQFFYSTKDEVAFNRYLSHFVVHQYLSSPGLFAKCVTGNAFNFWFRGKDTTVTVANVIVQLPYLLLGILGMYCAWRGGSNSPTVGVLVLYFVYGFAVYLPILAQARYSIPLIPILAIFSALALSTQFPRTAPRSPRITAGSSSSMS
jgi:4-amino-4-deoxy-L-arabinose transferase-like glycosyltransferase